MNVPASCGSLGNIEPVQMAALQPGLHSIQVPVKNSPVCTGTHSYSQGIQLIQFTLTLQLQMWEFRETPSNFLELRGTLSHCMVFSLQ